MNEIVMPHDLDLEKTVLGSVIESIHVYNEIRDILTEDCFYLEFHKNVFRVYKEIESKGESPDVTLVTSCFLSKYPNANMMDIVSLTMHNTFVGLYSHVCRLMDLSARRKIISIGHQLLTKGQLEQEDVSDLATYANESLSNLYINTDNSISTINDAVKGVYSIIDQNKSGATSLTGSPTGFSTFDQKGGGLQKGNLIIIAGETSQGKTSFALSVINNTARFGTKVAIYSLEMSKEELAARMMSIESGVPANQILYAPLADYQFERLDKSINGLCNSCILFDDRSNSNIDTIINSIRSMKMKYDIDGVMIDYLQILNVNMKDSNKEQQMGDVSRRLKNLAKDLGIWIIALSQLSRNQQSSEPSLKRLRDSGQIAEAADIVALVYRPEVYNLRFPEPFFGYETSGYAMIDFAKGRNIGLLKILCRFDKETTHFIDVPIHEIPKSDIIQHTKTPVPF